jgi:hypothetical protein
MEEAGGGSCCQLLSRLSASMQLRRILCSACRASVLMLHDIPKNA